MKKILTASLVAMMAVTAANADIASTAYVDNAKQVAEAKATEYNTAMNTRVKSLEGDNTTNKSDISQLKKDVAAIGGDGGSISTQIAAAVDGLDVGEIAVADGKYVKTVSETDGKVSVTTADLVTRISGADESSLVAPTTAAVTGYVKNQFDVLTNGFDTLSGGLSSLTSRLTTAEKDIDAAEVKIATLEANSVTKTELNNEKTAITGAIEEAKSEAIETANGETASQVSVAKMELQRQIDALNTGDNSVSKQIDNKIGTLADGAKDVATAIANAQTAAASDAASKADQALADAKADATSKADQALADAKVDAASKIAALDKADTAVAGSYVSAVSEENGVISVSRASLTPVAKMDVPADCATKLCALVYDKEKSTAVNPVLKWEVIAE